MNLIFLLIHIKNNEAGIYINMMCGWYISNRVVTGGKGIDCLLFVEVIRDNLQGVVKKKNPNIE